MKKILLIQSVIISLFCSTQVIADKILPDFDAQYAIEKFGVTLASARYQLARSNNRYHFKQSTRLTGLASMFADDTVDAESIIDIKGNQLLLNSHKYTQTGKEKNKNEDFSISWQQSATKLNGSIKGIVRSKKIELTTNTPIWEALSFQIPLMLEANNNQQTYPYHALLKGEIDTYEFKLAGNKTHKFADKNHTVLHLVRIDPKKDRQLHLWLAPDMHNIPVVVEHYRDGKLNSRMQLTSVKFNNNERLNDTETDIDEDDF